MESKLMPERRRFALHWGGGWIAEEARTVTPYHEPAVQLLEFDHGDEAIRFCYYHEGRFQTSPLILGKGHLPALRKEIRRHKKLHALLKQLV